MPLKNPLIFEICIFCFCFSDLCPTKNCAQPATTGSQPPLCMEEISALQCKNKGTHPQLMRSSRVVRASDSQCRSRNCPGFDPSILRHSGIWGAADEAVLNFLHKKNNPKILLYEKRTTTDTVISCWPVLRSRFSSRMTPSCSCTILYRDSFTKIVALELRLEGSRSADDTISERI